MAADQHSYDDDLEDESESRQQRLATLLEQAQAYWQDFADLRKRETLDEQIRFNLHAVDVPQTLIDDEMVSIYRTGIGPEKIDLAKALLIDPDGPDVDVAPLGGSLDAEDDRGLVEQWCLGFLSVAETQGGDRLSEVLTEDILLRSRGYVQVLPDPSVWADIATTQKDKATLQEKARHLPISVRWAPARSVVPVLDARKGLTELWEYAEMTVKEALSRFLDEDGNPLATRLEACVDQQQDQRTGLSMRSKVTVVTRADCANISIAITGEQFSQVSTEKRQDTTTYSVDELLYDNRPHGMGRVPYAYFPGRITAADDPALKYEGFLTPVASEVVELDTLETQRASGVRWSVWPGAQVTQQPDNFGTGDEPIEIVSDPARVTLMPVGMRLERIDWGSPNMQHMNEVLAAKRADIDRKTLTDAAYGTGNANSGYLNQQLINSTTTNLSPFVKALVVGGRSMCELALRAVCVLDSVLGPVPVRVPDTNKIVALTKRQAEQPWAISVNPRPTPPPGSEKALLDTVGMLYDRGWLDDVGAMRRLGAKNPAATLERAERDRMLKAPEIIALKTEMLKRQIFADLADDQSMQQPENPMVPESLMGMWRTPQAQERMPDFSATLGGMPGVPGDANLDAQAYSDGSQPPPTMNPVAQFNRISNRGGPAPGQSQASPGGGDRQSALLNGRAA